MKIVQSSLFRAICAIVVGALLVKYREQTVTWLTQIIGTIFFLSGVFSCVAYFVSRGKQNDTVEVYDANGKRLTPLKPVFPIVGLGSLIFGLMLTLMPGTFVTWLMYMLSAILILGAVSQFATLISAAHVARVGFYFWIMPALLLFVGLVAVISPKSIASAPLFVIGWAMMVYGVVEIINTVKVHQLRRSVERQLQRMQNESEEQQE